MKVLWDHQRNHFGPRDAPGHRRQVAVIMTSTCPFICFSARPWGIIYHCAAEKDCKARRLVCSRCVSAPTKQKLMNDGWGERQGIGQQLFSVPSAKADPNACICVLTSSRNRNHIGPSFVCSPTLSSSSSYVL